MTTLCRYCGTRFQPKGMGIAWQTRSAPMDFCLDCIVRLQAGYLAINSWCYDQRVATQARRWTAWLKKWGPWLSRFPTCTKFHPDDF